MTDVDRIQLLVRGTPKPAGSKRAFVDRGGNVRVKDDSGQAGTDWRGDCKAVAVDEMAGREPLLGPLRLEVDFILPRPKAHYGSGRNAAKLKDGAPRYHDKRPDATKLLRGLEDALTGIVWKDDSQIAAQDVRKVYADDAFTGAVVTVTRIAAGP